jgi:hypothetical protein
LLASNLIDFDLFQVIRYLVDNVFEWAVVWCEFLERLLAISVDGNPVCIASVSRTSGTVIFMDTRFALSMEGDARI